MTFPGQNQLNEKNIYRNPSSYARCRQSFATGEPSTYFQIFVPPNGTTVQRNVAIIVTAIYDSTSFSIIDDGADGDTDDTKSGMLMAGQSFIMYIGDNAVNDDARYAGGGALAWDGDYFIVKSDKLVLHRSQRTVTGSMIGYHLPIRNRLVRSTSSIRQRRRRQRTILTFLPMTITRPLLSRKYQLPLLPLPVIQA